MRNPLKSCLKTAFALSLMTLLFACGGGGSSSDNASVDYVHNLAFGNNTTLFASGYNGFGQLGNASVTNRSSMTKVKNGRFFSGFATGGNHSVAFFNNSTVRSWGYNIFGQLGNGTTTSSNEPVKTNDISGVKAVAAASRHTLALKNDDTLWAWGDNAFGQLGVDKADTPKPNEYSKKPVQAGRLVPGFANISSIAANGNFNLARANGKVWAWGRNRSGQLGVEPPVAGSTAADFDATPKPVEALSALGIIAVAAGGASGYALAQDGTVWAWGNNFDGQLGNGTTVNSHTPQRVLTAANVPLTNIVRIAAGVQHALAMDKDGQVWAWGYNIFGQLGNYDKKPNNQAPDDQPFAVQVVADIAKTPFTGATEIRAFGSSSMARKDGAWWGWGNNSYGQLGIGRTGNELLPVRLPDF